MCRGFVSKHPYDQHPQKEGKEIGLIGQRKKWGWDAGQRIPQQVVQGAPELNWFEMVMLLYPYLHQLPDVGEPRKDTTQLSQTPKGLRAEGYLLTILPTAGAPTSPWKGGLNGLALCPACMYSQERASLSCMYRHRHHMESHTEWALRGQGCCVSEDRLGSAATKKNQSEVSVAYNHKDSFLAHVSSLLHVVWGCDLCCLHCSTQAERAAAT